MNLEKPLLDAAGNISVVSIQQKEVLKENEFIVGYMLGHVYQHRF